MKRISFFVTIVTIVLSSCAKTGEGLSGEIDGSMTFGVSLIEATEGTKADNVTATPFVDGAIVGMFVNNTSADFVSAFDPNYHDFLTDKGLIANNQLKLSSNTWSPIAGTNAGLTNPAWPVTGRLTILAYYPWHTSNATIDTGALKIAWETSSTPSDQKDLLWDVIVDAHVKDRNGRNDNAPTTGVIPIKFAHALSRVSFKSGGLQDATVNKIVVSGGWISKGTFSITPVAGKKRDESTNTWTLSTVASDKINQFTVYDAASDNAWVNASTDVTLLMIPQDIGSASMVTITYEKVTNGTGTGDYTSLDYLLTNSSLNSWDKGKSITYTFAYESIPSLTLEATVEAWNGTTVNTALSDNY